MEPPKPDPSPPRSHRPWGLKPYADYLEVARAPIPDFDDSGDPLEARAEWLGRLTLAEGRDELPISISSAPALVTLESGGMAYVLQHPEVKPYE